MRRAIAQMLTRLAKGIHRMETIAYALRDENAVLINKGKVARLTWEGPAQDMVIWGGSVHFETDGLCVRWPIANGE